MPVRRRRVFIAHDFSEDRNHKGRFRRAIRYALAGWRCRAGYADVHVQDQVNLANIRKKILAADFCIVDVTNYHRGRRTRVNLNAVFEFGMAEAFGKPTTLIFKRGVLSVSREFSDVSAYLYLEYSSYADLSRKLRERLKALRLHLR